MARVVRRRKGRINRAILFLRPGEPKPMSASSVTGTTYSFKEPLEHGQAWDLKHLGGTRDGKTYAPPKMRLPFSKWSLTVRSREESATQIGGRYLARARGAFVRNAKAPVRAIGTSGREAAAR